MPNVQNTKKLLAFIIIASVAIRVGVALVLGNTVTELPGVSDQISYDTLAVRVAGGYGFTFDKTWWPLTYPDQPTAHWSFIYTLGLSAIYSIFGHFPVIFRIMQAILAGVFTPLFTYRIAQTVVGLPGALTPGNARLIALIAAGWAAFYGYFVYYAGTIMTEPLYITCILWVICVVLQLVPVANAGDAATAVAYPSPQKWLELGISISVTILLRQVFLLFVPFLCLWLLWVYIKAHNGRRISQNPLAIGSLVKGGSIAALVIVCAILPVTIFNFVRFKQFVLLNTNSGFAFFWANHPIYGDQFVPILTDGSYLDLIPVELRDLNEAQLDGALLRRGLGFVLDDPVRYIKLSLSRIPVYFMFWPSNQSSWLSNIVRVASFGFALPFALLGIIFWVRHILRLRYVNDSGILLFVFIIVYSSIHLLSWSLIRYRLPVDALLLIFASMGVGTLVEWTLKLRTQKQILSAHV